MESGERSVLGFDPFSGGLEVLPGRGGSGVDFVFRGRGQAAQA